ncbi:MAG: gluconate 2-dehydrogenase subunit 3 family protein [Vicinamibacterales bacterium]
MTHRTHARHDACSAAPGVTRREAIERVTLVLGGLSLIGELRLLASPVDGLALDQAMAGGVGSFTAADVALLDEIAETMLPETATPGARAAKTGAFMALMVTDAYTEPNRRVFRDGLTALDERCRAAHGAGFLQTSPAGRLALLDTLDREQRTATAERENAARSRAPAAESVPDDEPSHYFRMMKELALLGYFTSEIGYTHAMRYIESPGRFDPCAPHAPGDRSWAPHA